MFRLSEFLQYDNIVIQCHDNPDADTISSAFGIYTYLLRNGKNAKIIYAGVEHIQKRNILLMLEWLNIPIEHVKHADKFPKTSLLICVDCQYGEGNVTRIEADTVAVIDHHLQVIDEFDLGVIQCQLGGCATLVWDLLCQEEFDFAIDKDIPASLYYGLLTDTNDFNEISHPLDKDMRDSLSVYCDRGIVKRLRQCNITVDELEVAGVALLRNYINYEKRYALFKSEFCDPNILGFISDIALQVDSIDICVIYSLRVDAVRLSIRSSSREVMASQLVKYLTNGVGSGGGHREKAGGWIQKPELDELGIGIEEYMKTKTAEYFDSYDIINASDHNIDTNSMECYKKRPIPKGFVASVDVFEVDTPIMLRTLEGDSNTKVSPDVYLMIGVRGEVYPIKCEKFHSYYKPCDESVPMGDNIYTPTVKNEKTGETKELLPYMKPCIAFNESPIYATKLTRNVKIFTEWNPNGYMYGNIDDYLAIKCDDLHDVYIIQKDIFPQTYEGIDNVNHKQS